MNHVLPARRAALAAVLALALPAAAAAQAGAPRELPRTHAPRPTVPAITPGDLMTRLYVIADDSMLGREGGSVGNAKVTAYIADELRRMGLEPAGENGTFFQTVPIVRRAVDPAARLVVDGAPLALWTDFAPLPEYAGVFPFGREMSGEAVPVVYGGRIGGEMLEPALAAGRLVVFAPPLGPDGHPSSRYWAADDLSKYGAAAGVAVASLDATESGLLGFVREPQTSIRSEGPEPARRPLGMLVGARAAAALLGAPPEG
ncbi:MAG: peptidase, partial [Gemmatimonadetes bacterium]|nr:peptidase [Gemmatimonadota bacterium]